MERVLAAEINEVMGWRRQRFEEMPGRNSIGRVEQVERCIYSREGLL
jgi:hypothetical protein